MLRRCLGGAGSKGLARRSPCAARPLRGEGLARRRPCAAFAYRAAAGAGWDIDAQTGRVGPRGFDTGGRPPLAILQTGAVSTYWVKYKGTRFPIRRGETILGRSPYCSIVISDDLVSREHCALRLTTEGLTVTDLNSTNGVRVNGTLIKGTQSVQPGDVLTVGTALLEVMRMDTMRSRARTTTRSDLEIPKQLDSTVTLTQENSLELIETLLQNASESGRAPQVASVIRRAIDELVSKQTQTGSASSPTRERLLACIEELRSWFAEGSFDEWANDTKFKLDDLGAH